MNYEPAWCRGDGRLIKVAAKFFRKNTPNVFKKLGERKNVAAKPSLVWRQPEQLVSVWTSCSNAFRSKSWNYGSLIRAVRRISLLLHLSRSRMTLVGLMCGRLRRRAVPSRIREGHLARFLRFRDACEVRESCMMSRGGGHLGIYRYCRRLRQCSVRQGNISQNLLYLLNFNIKSQIFARERVVEV